MEKLNSENNKNTLLAKAKAKGPINIALVKYWGKSDEKLNLPLNDSLSITLDMENMFSYTEVELFGDEKTKENFNIKSEVKITLELNEK